MSECPICGEKFQSETAVGLHRQQSHDVPWRDKEKLHNLYVEKGLEKQEIAERWDCSGPTIGRWVEKHGLKRKFKQEDWLIEMYVDEGMKISEMADLANCTQPPIMRRLEELGVEKRISQDYIEAPWRDRDEFKKLYVDKELTLEEIANKFNSHISTIRNWVGEHGFEYRGNYVNRANYYTTRKGYEKWNVSAKDGTDTVAVHRLAAVAWFGIEQVKDMHIHHKNSIEWDNREENIEPMSHGEHMAHHNRVGKYESKC